VTTEAILATLAKTPMKTAELQSAFSASHAKPQVAMLMDRLQRKGLVKLSQGSRWELTTNGYAMVQRQPEPRPWKPYEPPKVMRRIGSDRASKIPSRF
jgi:DNA-binding IclR family transcriptional regulator